MPLNLAKFQVLCAASTQAFPWGKFVGNIAHATPMSV